VEVEEDNVEWNYFEKFEEDIGSKMTPYRTEWMVWDNELKFAGSIDMIYENDDGSLEIYDWKRSKGIKFGNDWENATTECIKHLPNCNHILYSLQLNTYKALLEKNYGKKVKGMYLVVLHPNNKKKTYHRIPVDDLEKEVTDLFELRKKMLQKRT
jgi:ATP-dependent exoDNAse (exonuclease V) beta subunit